MDNNYIQIDLDEKTYSELKNICDKNGITLSGLCKILLTNNVFGKYNFINNEPINHKKYLSKEDKIIEKHPEFYGKNRPKTIEEYKQTIKKYGSIWD